MGGAVFHLCCLVWDSWTLKGKSDSVSCGHNAPFSWPWCSQGFVRALQESVPPVLWKFCDQTHCLQSQIAWGFSVPLPRSQVGKSVVGPRTFLTLQEFLWYNHSATRWRSRRTCAHLLQELENCNLLLNYYWQENVGSHQKKIYPSPRAKEKPQQNGRRGEIAFRIKPPTHPRCLTVCAPGPRGPTETEPDLPLSVWVSTVEARVSSGLPQG